MATTPQMAQGTGMAPAGQPSSIMLAIHGLVLNPSTFGSNAPTGALSIANNVVIDRQSVVETRRGFDNSFSTLHVDGAKSMFQYNNTKLLNTTDGDLHVDKNSDGVYTIYDGIYPVPQPSNSASRVRGIETNKNFYFITENGTYRLDHINGQPRKAGAPPGLSGTGVAVGVSGFLPANTNIAYRIVFGYRDFNQQLILGAPSSIIIISNGTTGVPATTSANTEITFQLPKEIYLDPTDYIFQVYRGNASPDLATAPDDEMALVYEDVCVGTPTITVSDITPVALVSGAALYTNQGQDGILQSNYRPPWAMDICTFKQYAFYANCRTFQLANLTLIAAGSGNGPDALVPGDTVTFTVTNGGPTFTLTAVAGANNFALGWFSIPGAGVGTGNPGYDIQVTASNMALVANAYASNIFLSAYYISSNTDLPGQMRFDKLDLDPTIFNISSSNVNCWEQAVTSSDLTTPLVSNNDFRPNRIYYSKFNQPEAVPVVNYIEVGSANQPIRRIVPLRDGVMVLKDDGVFRISSAAPPFVITPIDYNVRILADNTAAELDNKVYFLSDQGVVALNDSDAQIMSILLDKTIIENTSPTLFPNLQEVAWGIAYQSARKYILCMPTTGIDIQATQQYVYNHIYQVWTRWTLSGTCGLIFKLDGKMYLGSAKGSAPGIDNSYVYQERKDFTSADYADNEYTTNNTTAANTNTIVIANPALPSGVTILPGWTVTQSTNSTNVRVVSSTAGPSFTTLVLDSTQQWTVGDITIYTPVYTEVQTVQIDCANPGMNKLFTEIIYIFTEQSFSNLHAKISSNTSGAPIDDYLIPTLRGGWGLDPWGTSPWGGSPTGQGKIRRVMPQKIARAGWLYVNIANAEAFTKFGWSGLDIRYRSTSVRQK